MERGAKIGIVNAYESAPKSQEDKFQNTIAFLKAAIAEGAHLKIPLYIYKNKKTNKEISEVQWVREKNIIGIYFGSPAVLEDIGRMYRITGEMVRLIKDRGMRNLWKNCSLETQAVFPLQELALDKPRSQKSKERTSRSRGGISISIREQMASGKSVKQIREEGQYSKQQVLIARATLKAWGIEVPYIIHTPHSQNLELEKNLKNADTDEEKQELLNQVKRKFYEHHGGKNDPLLMSVRNIFNEAGFNGYNHPNFTILLASLKKLRFPMGEIYQKQTSGTGKEKIVRYHFLLSRDKERAKQILLSDPNLQRFRRS